MGPSAGPQRLSKKTTFTLLPPMVVALSGEQRREAVALLAELLLDAAREENRGVSGGVSGGVLDGASGGASGSVVPFPERRRKARDAA